MYQASDQLGRNECNGDNTRPRLFSCLLQRWHARYCRTLVNNNYPSQVVHCNVEGSKIIAILFSNLPLLIFHPWTQFFFKIVQQPTVHSLNSVIGQSYTTILHERESVEIILSLHLSTKLTNKRSLLFLPSTRKDR